MNSERTDEDLMLAYGQGDVVAFERLYQRHRGGLYRFLLRHLKDESTTQELYQETWSRVIGSRERYRPEARFSTWMLQIAHNLCVDHWRRLRPNDNDAEQILLAIQGPEQEQPDHQLSTFEQRRRLQLALDELPPDQREAFLLRAEMGLGLEEIATATGVGRETAKSRLRYALVKLREILSS